MDSCCVAAQSFHIVVVVVAWELFTAAAPFAPPFLGTFLKVVLFLCFTFNITARFEFYCSFFRLDLNVDYI